MQPPIETCIYTFKHFYSTFMFYNDNIATSYYFLTVSFTMNLFFLKKILSVLLMPLSIVIILLLIAIIFHKFNNKFSFRCLFLATLVLIFSSLPPVSKMLISSLEEDYVAYNISNKREDTSLDYIVVLGCYHFSDANLPATIELKTCSLQRLVEAIRLANLYPEAQLIMSGAAGHNPQSNAQKMKEAAILMGIEETRIITEHTPGNTQQEANLIAPYITGKHAVLITNADHMKRAMKYFTQQGASPTPAPASFYAKGDVKSEGLDLLYYVPKSYSLQETTVYWYETLGLTAQWFIHLATPKQALTDDLTDKTPNLKDTASELNDENNE